MHTYPKPGIYRHYEGNICEVMGVAKQWDTREETVVYRWLFGEYDLVIQPLEIFMETLQFDGVPVQRFTWLGERPEARMKRGSPSLKKFTPSEYIQNAMRTEGGNYRFSGTGDVTPRIEHAVMGIVTEGAELLDAIKKTKMYDKPLDRINLIEEAGDCMWYLALLSDELGISFEDIWEKNIAKLRARYPEKWEQSRALARDVAQERRVLES